MPTSRRTRHDIWYDTAGDSGSPVLLVMGFTMRGTAWRHQIEELAAHHRVAWFDNVGIGESGRIRARVLQMRHMADDALGVIRDLGWDSAHVVGVSMGGMIAQHMALRAPDRVRSLALASTHPGGPRHVLPPLEGARLFAGTALPGADRRLDALSALLFGPRSREEQPERIRALLREDFRRHLPISTAAAQLGAIAAHNVTSRLRELHHPALVLQPGRDVLVDPRGSEALAAGLPNATLMRFDEAGHVLPREYPADFNRAILDHLAEVDARATDARRWLEGVGERGGMSSSR